MPPLKKFRPVDGNTHPANPFAPGPSPVSENKMHKMIMNGPTLSPQGQVPPPSQQRSQVSHGIPPPPGLRSPPAPAAYSNGYTHHVGQQNGYKLDAQISSRALPPGINGVGENGSKQTNPGWSASYSPPQPHLPPHQTPQYPPSGSPYLNSIPRQPPSTPHATNNVGSPSKPHTLKSPLESNQQPSLPSFPTHSHSNGSPLQQPSPIFQPPAHSPIKQQSSPPPQPPLPPSSSPTAPPSLQKRGPSPPGLSPTKHSSPRPAPPPGHDLAASKPVMSPVIQPLSSPRFQQRNPSSPGLSPTKHSPPRPAPLPGHGVTGTPIMPPVALEPSPGQAGFQGPSKEKAGAVVEQNGC